MSSLIHLRIAARTGALVPVACYITRPSACGDVLACIDRGRLGLSVSADRAISVMATLCHAGGGKGLYPVTIGVGGLAQLHGAARVDADFPMVCTIGRPIGGGGVLACIDRDCLGLSVSADRAISVMAALCHAGSGKGFDPVAVGVSSLIQLRCAARAGALVPMPCFIACPSCGGNMFQCRNCYRVQISQLGIGRRIGKEFAASGTFPILQTPLSGTGRRHSGVAGQRVGMGRFGAAGSFSAAAGGQRKRRAQAKENGQ